MNIPVIQGIIDRRILVNYRVDPDALARLLPSPFRPKIVNGSVMAGICLIRLKALRPIGVPRWFGASSENAAHRVAVEWEQGGQTRDGVFIWRRDTNSRLNALMGGRVFPGIHHHSSFAVKEPPDSYRIELHSDDGESSLRLRGQTTDRWPATSIFRSLDEAADFFQRGGLGFSPTNDPSRFQAVELRCRKWRVEPLHVVDAHSSFFEDESLFPKGSVQFDCALLMRGIDHEWHGYPDLCWKRSVEKTTINHEPAAG